MGKTLQILVVEDSNIQAHNLNRILTRHGFSVTLRPDALTALTWLTESLPDVIITDIMMPGMDGFEFCRRIRENPALARVPVIVLTELSDPFDVFQGLRSGADCFVTKPYDEEFLVERIQTVLENQSIRETAPGRVIFKGHAYKVNSSIDRATDLLFATYENAIQKNRELIRINRELADAKRELQRQNRELESLHDEKNRFIGIAAHDLRSPLGIVLGFSEILLEEYSATLDTTQLDSLKRIRGSSQFMLTLVDDLLDVSRIEAGRLDLKPREERLADLVRDSVELHRLAASAKSILIESNLPLDLPVVLLDPIRITQVLNNLVGNAIKYSFPGGLIDIAARTRGAFVEVSIRDRGPGIPREEQEKLFRPFSRTSVQPSQGEKSTGLGLAIVKKIVEAHGGQVRVESEEGRGATFTFTLPTGGPVSSNPADPEKST